MTEAALAGLAVDLHRNHAPWPGQPLLEAGDVIGGLADQSLEGGTHPRDRARVVAGADHQATVMPPGIGRRDRLAPARQDGLHGAADVRSDPDLMGQHVRGAERNDAQRQRPPGKPVDDLVDGAVAARRHHGVICGLVGLPRDSHRIAPRRGLGDGHRATGLFKQFQRPRVSPRPALAGGGIADNQQAARRHGC